MTFKDWLKLWGALFVLAVVPREPAAGSEPASDDPDPQADLDLDATGGDEPVLAADDIEDDDDPVALKAARDANKKAAEEARADAERHRLDAETLRRAVPPPTVPPTEEQNRRSAEDRELADPKIDPNRKWQIEANRTLRETKSRTDATLFQAQDLSDKATFDLACAQNKRLAAVKGEVEEELKKARAVGQNPPREAMAFFLLGKKVATTPEKKPTPVVKAGSERGTQVRSDVRPNGKLTDHQKRAKRLENIQI
jgi:hypothetical protein